MGVVVVGVVVVGVFVEGGVVGAKLIVSKVGTSMTGPMSNGADVEPPLVPGSVFVGVPVTVRVDGVELTPGSPTGNPPKS